MKKNVFALAACAALALSLAACGGSAEETTAAETKAVAETEAASESKEESAEETEAASEAAPAETVQVKIGASVTPHAEILEYAKPALLEKGVDIEIQEFTDYVIPNTSLESGDLDANYFQHLPYLEEFNKERGTHLVSAGMIHYEPFGIFAGTKTDLSEVADGDKIAVPNDTTNEARALLLLEAQGLLKLKEDAGITATKQDIVENPHNLDIVELEAAQIPKSLQSVSYAVMNGNYALQADMTANDALAVEDADSIGAKTYGNVIAVQEGRENEPWVKTLVEVLHSDDVKNWIEETYQGAVVPID